MFRKADRERMERIEHKFNEIANTQGEKWVEFMRFQVAQFKAITEGQDKLMQSHAALEAELTTKPNRIDLAATHEALNRLNEFVGANQAVLDTLVQRMDTSAEAWDKGYEAGIEATICVKCDKDAKRKASTNGKRKR